MDLDKSLYARQMIYIGQNDCYGDGHEVYRIF